MSYVFKISLIIIVLAILIVGCASKPPEATDIGTTETVSFGRFGTIPIESVGASNVNGTFTAQDLGSGATQITIELKNSGDFNPWGIYNTGDCKNGVPDNTRPVFTLPDIELGHREEKVETAAFASTPGNLIVIIYGLGEDGSQKIVACA